MVACKPKAELSELHGKRSVSLLLYPKEDDEGGQKGVYCPLPFNIPFYLQHVTQVQSWLHLLKQIS